MDLPDQTHIAEALMAVGVHPSKTRGVVALHSRLTVDVCLVKPTCSIPFIRSLKYTTQSFDCWCLLWVLRITSQFDEAVKLGESKSNTASIITSVVLSCSSICIDEFLYIH